jgi:hypothetical protein
MRAILGISIGTALALMAGGALADETSGKIAKIDPIAKTLTVDEKTFQWSSENSMGVKLDELKEGDQVKIRYETNTDGTSDVVDIAKEQ